MGKEYGYATGKEKEEGFKEWLKTVETKYAELLARWRDVGWLNVQNFHWIFEWVLHWLINKMNI